MKINRLVILANECGGLYGFRKELIAELLKNSEVFVVTPGTSKIKELKELGCKVINIELDRRGMNIKNDCKLFLTYLKLLQEMKPEMVITYTIKPNIYGGCVCLIKKIPYAVNITGLGTAFQKDNLLRKIIVAMYRVALKKAKVVFFENIENLNIFLGERIIKKKQVCLLNGAGVNLERYTLQKYPAKEKVRFLFMGRIMQEKGVDELLKAMERLHIENYECCLDILGRLEEDYSEIIAKCENEGWLNYRGLQKDVRPFIADSHCLVLPSWHEGMANTNLECAASGRPLITSNIHGCKEAVIENVSGFLCEPKNVDSLYNAMKMFLDLPQEERINMGLAGRKHMEEIFDKKKVVKETILRLEIQ